jgi:membrane protein implicated in regulation of membrane protease activity
VPKNKKTGAKCKDLLSHFTCSNILLPQNVACVTHLKVNMTESTVWWVLAGATVALELVTGTFYLLMISTGLVAAAVSVYFGAGIVVQLVVAAVVSGGSVVAWRSYRLRVPAVLPANANPDVNLDVGETVHVDAWDAEGNSSVKYRGASWSASLVPGSSPSAGLYQIVEVVGSRLVVKKV